MIKSAFFKVLSAFIGIMMVFTLSACDLGLSIPEYIKNSLTKLRMTALPIRRIPLRLIQTAGRPRPLLLPHLMALRLPLLP